MWVGLQTIPAEVFTRFTYGSKGRIGEYTACVRPFAYLISMDELLKTAEPKA